MRTCMLARVRGTYTPTNKCTHIGAQHAPARAHTHTHRLGDKTFGVKTQLMV